MPHTIGPCRRTSASNATSSRLSANRRSNCSSDSRSTAARRSRRHQVLTMFLTMSRTAPEFEPYTPILSRRSGVHTKFPQSGGTVVGLRPEAAGGHSAAPPQPEQVAAHLHEVQHVAIRVVLQPAQAARPLHLLRRGHRLGPGDPAVD